MTLLDIYLFLVFLTNSVSSAEVSELDCSTVLGSTFVYSTNMRIVGFFIILFASSFGMFSSLLLGSKSIDSRSSSSFPKQRDRTIERILQLSKMFGVGVIAGTAWTHLLPAAFRHFSAPCLDPWWAYYGTSWVGVFALFAGFAVQNIEIMGRDKIRKVHELKQKRLENTLAGFPASDLTINRSSQDIGGNNVIDDLEAESRNSSIQEDEILECQTKSIPSEMNKLDDAPTMQSFQSLEPPMVDDANKNASNVTVVLIDDRVAAEQLAASKSLKIKEAEAIKKVSTIVMEAGVMVHSLVIGLTLGVSSDSAFPTLLLAISFHQIFEGVAMGAILSDTSLSKKSKIALGIIYPIATPIGIAIGISIQSPYFESSIPTILLSEGILESLSSGILLYSTYCELIGGEINHSAKFDKYDSKFKSHCFMAMYLGVAAMAFLGVWT